ncbi:B3 domain-containing protein Os07g0563300-like isoform X2 [Curcuma longa]|uniref:B3 domain-containing protein Os07g0563300-like isoform X2 n=1 Tax=Curcuma longa TaxID=136217 RepID=UPI003D9EEFED
MSPPSPAAAVAKICFNSQCKEPLPDPPPARRKGWRLRSGEISELCDRCSCTFEQGNFCETYHSDDGGWRNCEACGKRVHCGCIVSATAYVLLDAGGVDCVACATKPSAMAPNQMISSPMLVPPLVTERREFPAKSWKSVNGPFFGQWRQASHMWNMTSAQSDLQQRLSYEFDRPNTTEKFSSGGRFSVLAHEKKIENISDRPTTSSLSNIIRGRCTNMKVRIDGASSFGTFREGNTDGVQDSHNLAGDNDSVRTRKKVSADCCSTISSGAIPEAQPISCISSLSLSNVKEEPSSLGLVASIPSANGSKEQHRFSTRQPQHQASPPLSKQFYPQSVNDAELQIQMHNGKPRIDNLVRPQLLPRYWPRITDQELQQISGDSNVVITPLFEKMLSASDAGRIGRLVLPKKCAEAYFPAISQPEGLPLKVKDANGKDWVFQFRFWPNNNSRMYVLEGVTPCIQAMQLQAGDTVTFSRMDPKGTLIMGFRKASGASNEQDSQTLKPGNDFSAPPEADCKITAKDLKGSVETRNLASTVEQRNCSKFANEGLLGLSARSSQGTSRRKGGNLGSKTKRLRIDSEDSMELKLTWEEAQQLLRPSPNCVPNIVLVEGHEFEEYEEAPVFGKCTYFAANQTRSSCSAAQELSLEQLAELIPCKTGPSKRSRVKAETDMEVSDGLDTLANLAILGEGENLPPPSQPTTKHPRHRPGCTCIVCIQPPSGKGPKHKQTCTCNVCLTVKRRFRTLMLRREKRQSEKEAETSVKHQKQQPNLLPEKTQVGNKPSKTSTLVVTNSPTKPISNEEGTSDEALESKRLSLSPLRAPQIDLNIQPEREEEPSPKFENGNMISLLANVTT